MFKNEYLLNVDLKKKMSAVVPTFVQYDSATLLFKIFDNGKPFDLTGFTRAEVAHRRPDGITVVETGTIESDSSGNKFIRYTYLGSEMHKEGYNETSLTLFSTDKKVSIQPFRVQIITDLRDALVESAKEEVGILQELIVKVESLVDKANTAVTVAEQASTDAAQAVVDANIAKTTAETAANDANLAKDGAVLATQDAIDATNAAYLAKTATEQATTEAIVAKNEASSAAALANEKAGLADLATTNANAKIGEVDLKIAEVDTAIFDVNKVKDETLSAKTATETATTNANIASDNANAKATLADEKATLATNAATNADTKASLAEQKATLAETAANNANMAKAVLDAALPNIQNLENALSYESATQYKKNNIVEYNGSAFQALQDTIGNPPPTLPEKTNLYWSLIAQRGIDGTGSVVSVNGISPDINGNVDIGSLETNWVDIKNKPLDFNPSPHTHEIININGLQEALDNAGTKEVATPLSNGLMSKEDKSKLDTIDPNANNYIHPDTHPASMITGLSSVAVSGDFNELANLPVIGTSASKDTGVLAGNVPVIGIDGKLDASILPTFSSSVESVNGKTGVVEITKNDLGLNNVTNIEQASKIEFDEHALNEQIHITPLDRNNWNIKETVEGSQEKANIAETNAKSYTDQKVINLNVFEAQEEFIATEGQTLFTLVGSYEVGKKRLSVTVGGVPQYAPNNFTETSANSFTLAEGVPVGELVIAKYYKALPVSENVVASVNNILPDINGNVEMTIPDPDLTGLATKGQLTTHSSKVASATELGHIMIGRDLEISEDGKLNVAEINYRNSGADLNDLVDIGLYYTSSSTLNKPTSSGNYYIEVKATKALIPTYAKQVAWAAGGNAVYFRTLANSVWSEWEKIVTANDSEWINATPQNGWAIESGQHLKYRKQGSIVSLSGNLKVGNKVALTLVTTLPVGFRPLSTINVAFRTGLGAPSNGIINNLGQFMLAEDLSASVTSLTFEVIFMSA